MAANKLDRFFSKLKRFVTWVAIAKAEQKASPLDESWRQLPLFFIGPLST